MQRENYQQSEWQILSEGLKVVCFLLVYLSAFSKLSTLCISFFGGGQDIFIYLFSFRYFLFFFLFFTLFYFTILYWFCHTSTWIRHGCTWVPNPEPPSHLPLYTISLGHPSAPAPSILYPVSNIDWRFVSSMFQCHSPKSSHPRPLPQSPKDCAIHLCLFCCLAYRVVITISLNSIYMC